MIKIEFQDQTFNIPSQWGDLTLAQYEQWFDHKPSDQREYVDLVANISGISAEMLLDSPRKLFDVVNQSISFIFDPDMPPSQSVEINDSNFYVGISDELTLGEWVDVDSVLASDSTTKISDILAIVCRPMMEDYDPKLSDERRDLFRNLSCEKALPLLAFFLCRKKESDRIMALYSNLLGQADQYLQDTKDFVKNGDGTKQLPIWQRIKYKILIRSLEKQLAKCSHSLSTK